MPPALDSLNSAERPVILTVASAPEAEAVLQGLDCPDVPDEFTSATIGRFVVLRTGVGKINAASALALHLDPHRHAGVVQIGIAGALPSGQHAAPSLGQVVLAGACALADEGLGTPGGFVPCHEMGFALGPFRGCLVPTSGTLNDALSPLADRAGVIATVSTCSGTDALATATAERTGAIAEGMEGAASALVALRLGVPFAEVRVISNTTGDRDRQAWDLAQALARLRGLAARL